MNSVRKNTFNKMSKLMCSSSDYLLQARSIIEMQQTIETVCNMKSLIAQAVWPIQGKHKEERLNSLHEEGDCIFTTEKHLHV